MGKMEFWDKNRFLGNLEYLMQFAPVQNLIAQMFTYSCCYSASSVESG